MKTSELVYLGDLRTECVHLQSQNKIITDAPLDNHGKGEFFSPTDLLATSLASCMLTVLGILAQRSSFSVDGTKAEVLKVMSNEPRRVAEIHIDLTFPKNNYTEKEKKMIQQAITKCPVSHSLNPEIKQIVNCIF